MLVVPILNEARSLPYLFKRLAEVFTQEACKHRKIAKIQLLLIDDGSTDEGYEVASRADLEHLERFDVKWVELSRNFGHQAAVTAGMALADGDAVAILDADLQDPPEVVLEMVDKWREGFEIVYGQRKNRKEAFHKVFGYWLFYRIYKALTPIAVPLDSGDFCLLDRRVVSEINHLPESLRFPRGLRSWVGFRQVGVKYDRPKRVAGETKYTFSKLYELATEGIASLSLRPLQLAQLLAFTYLVVSFGFSLYTVAKLLSGGSEDIWREMVVLLILLSNALILFCMYILGAYVGRTYLESKGRPTYIVREVISLTPEGRSIKR